MQGYMDKKTDGFIFKWHVVLFLYIEKICCSNCLKIVFFYLPKENISRGLCESKNSTNKNQRNG